MLNEDQIKAVADAIKKRYSPCKIILFGSYARNMARENSDIDILVISDREKELPRYKRGLQVRMNIPYFDKGVDMLFYSQREIDEWRDVPQSFVYNALNEGRVL